MARFALGLSTFIILLAVSCTSGPEFVPDRGVQSGNEGEPDSSDDIDQDSDMTDDSDALLPCEHECLGDRATCTDQEGIPHSDLFCPDEGFCCELDKGAEDTDVPEDNPCIHDCMANWLCQFRGTPHPDMSCKGNNVCCELGGETPGGPGNDNPNDNPCQFDCVSFFECRGDGAERHDEMSCDRWTEVCCEFEDSTPDNPDPPDPTDDDCKFDCVSFFECRGESVVRHDEMSCGGGWSEVCCEFEDSSPETPDPDGPADPCLHECVRPNRCESRGGTPFPGMTCEGNRLCCRF